MASECKTERILSSAEQLARLDPKFKLDLLDFDIFSSSSFVAGYEYRVEPAYTNGLYSREDRWQISTEVLPDKLIEKHDLELKLTAGLKHHVEANFIRFLQDPCKAMLLKPYLPNNLPLNSKKALSDKFNIGDYFLFRGSAGVLLSGEILSFLSSGFWGLGLTGSYFLEGFYQLHIVRIDDKHVRLKIVAHHGRNTNAALGLGWSGEFDVFKVNALDNQLEKFVNVNPIKVRGDLSKANVVMVDYVLDLGDEKVAGAFDTIIKKLKFFKEFALLSPLKDQQDITNLIVLDLAPLEDLFQTDRQNDQIGRIQRNLSTTSNQHAQGFGIDLGNKVVGFKWNREKSTSNMGVRRDDNYLDKYLLKTWENSWQGRFIYSWSKNTEESGVRVLFKEDENLKTLSAINLVNYLYSKKNRFSYNDLVSVQKKLKKSLPIEIYDAIPWGKWPQTPKTQFTNFGLRYDFIMSPESIISAPELSEEEIKVLFKDHIASKGLTVRSYASPRKDVARGTMLSAEEVFERRLKIFAKYLSLTLSRKLTIEERLGALAKLIKNDLFKASGFSFVMALRPHEMKSLYHLNLNISANEAKIDFSFGKSELSALYKKLLTVKAALDDDALDLLREAESISSLPTK